MIRVVAHVTAREGHNEALEAILIGLLAPTRAEHGCEFYDLHVGDDPQIYTFVEGWASSEALDLHLASDHIEEAMLAIRDHVVGAPDIRRFTKMDV